MLKKLWFFLRYNPLANFFRSLIPDFIVNSFWHLPIAILAAVFFRFPSRKLKIIGVTGTDGKTTTASLIYDILIKANQKAALITSVSAKIGGKELPTGFHVTSPHPFKLQNFLRKIAERGDKYVVLEVTSHGLAQHRVWGINFLIGVITNVTQEHLDYHRTYEEYLATKTKLLLKSKLAVLNRDDESYKHLASKLKTPARWSRSRPPRRWREKTKVITYGIKNRADFSPETFKFRTFLPGEFNQYNCLAAIAVTKEIGISEKKIRETLSSFSGVKGRMEKINEGQPFEVFVDFAHTPNALKKVMQILRKSLASKALSAGQQLAPKLIVVFGCAGLRDFEKRPVMGQIAAQNADLIVLTAEDPRTENLNEIIDQIAEGCLESGARESGQDTPGVAEWTLPEWRKNKKPVFFRIPDRRQAIRFAIQKLAKKGDVVAILGKGHEQSMCFGKTEYPWSDQKEVKKALREIM